MMTANMGNFFSTLIHDVRFALRTLRKSPGFTCAALLTLALGIGANTAIYAIIDGVLLHPIPFATPEKLVAMYQKTPHRWDVDPGFKPQRVLTCDLMAALRHD
jgi:hypothetical protein